MRRSRLAGTSRCCSSSRRPCQQKPCSKIHWQAGWGFLQHSPTRGSRRGLSVGYLLYHSGCVPVSLRMDTRRCSKEVCHSGMASKACAGPAMQSRPASRLMESQCVAHGHNYDHTIPTDQSHQEFILQAFGLHIPSRS
jgi:hypothetical protein